MKPTRGIWPIGTVNNKGDYEMAQMISPAGEMEVKISDIKRADNQLVVTGQIGVWDSKIYIPPEEVGQLIRLMFNLSFLLYIVIFPFVYLK